MKNASLLPYGQLPASDWLMIPQNVAAVDGR